MYNSIIDIDAEKSDTDKLSMVCYILHVGTAGNVKVTTESGQTQTLYNAYRMVYVPNGVNQVFSTDTTATQITGMR